jgi:hypothetical protein
MQPAKISVMGDDFLLFSLSEGGEVPSNAAYGVKAVVLLGVGTNEDFSLTAYSAENTPVCEYCSAAICAAAFLKQKRGLPLSEFTFETPNGILEIFNTGVDKYTATLPKCKRLYTKGVDLLGCDAEYSDISVSGNLFRAVSSKDIRLFDRKILPSLLTIEGNLPSSAVLSSSKGGRLFSDCYTEFSTVKPTSLIVNAVSAYNEYLHKKTVTADFSLDDGVSLFFVRHSDVIITTTPTLH